MAKAQSTPLKLNLGPTQTSEPPSEGDPGESLVNEKTEKTDTDGEDQPDQPGQDDPCSDHPPIQDEKDALIQRLNNILKKKDNSIQNLTQRALEAERKAISYSKQSRRMRIFCELIAAAGQTFMITTHGGKATSQKDIETMAAHLAGVAMVLEDAATQKKF